ncbi:hypothetical protein JHK87_043480 [Glycine soja]|nr:hypothetical protein JHK87_043480 [Glycine soja]
MLRQRLSVLSTSIIRSSNHSKPILRYPSIQSHPFQLRHSPSSQKQPTRKGRGIGSGKGKTAGRGHKGQRARKGIKLGFEGGQTPLRRRLPKRGFKNPFSLTFQPIGLGKIAKFINAGKIDSSELITMKILKDAGVLGKQMKDGVRLMGRGSEQIKWPIHQEVSRVTVRAKEAVEAAGGSVRRVYYNKLGLKALVKPECFEKKGRLLPRAARPPPKQKDKVDSIGRLPAPTKPIPFLVEASKDLPKTGLGRALLSRFYRKKFLESFNEVSDIDAVVEQSLEPLPKLAVAASTTLISLVANQVPSLMKRRPQKKRGSSRSKRRLNTSGTLVYLLARLEILYDTCSIIQAQRFRSRGMLMLILSVQQARGLSPAQATVGSEQIQIQVPNEKVGLIIGRSGETIKSLQTKSGVRIQLIPQHLSEGDDSKERTVQVTGDKRQIQIAQELIKEVMNQWFYQIWLLCSLAADECLTKGVLISIDNKIVSQLFVEKRIPATFLCIIYGLSTQGNAPKKSFKPLLPPEALLSIGHYHTKCPDAEGIISQKVAAWVKKDPTLAPAIIRLHFHDCAVGGCDASILLNHPGSERTALESRTLRGFQLIDNIKLS